MSRNLDISEFIDSVIRTHKSGKATEHSYRPALETLFNSLQQGVTATNEPKRVKIGAPDFIIQRGEIAVGHVEAKDIDIDLHDMDKSNKEQQERYRNALPNLIYTNCLDWDFYRNGQLYASVTIGDFLLGIQPKPDQYTMLENLLRDFIAQRPQTITSPRVLAGMMAGKAALIKNVLHNALTEDKDEDTELFGQYEGFRKQLIHDIRLEDFADLYAETIAYGMFAARLHDTTQDTFTRQEALELLPKSNPFLRSLFKYISNHDLDDRIVWVIDDLATIFQATNVKKLMAGFGKLTGQNDPFLHFYETFIAAYNPSKRRSRGVWYTPEPVVNFIVRAVDDVLQSEFGLPMGLADTSKVTIDWDTGQTQKKKGTKNAKTSTSTIQKEVHRVQILDPATGTGTFLAEVIKQIAPKVKGIASGKWSGYLEESLIPRLHGFELLMASYAMCHMKLDMLLTELGYKPSAKPPRLSVYLTNSLEEGEIEAQDLFRMLDWLTREAREANVIKRQTPIMCVIGNPPYFGESANKGEWIMGLMDAYKKEPGGKIKLQEKNSKWINDDYVKFIRMSEHLIERTGEGVLGFITNHSYLTNPTFRGMRWHLLRTFDKIYVLDLHGSTKPPETAPNGEKNGNVFDIQKGVAILIGVKKRIHAASSARVTNDPDESLSCQAFHADLWGDRESKYEALRKATLANHAWKKLQLNAPHYSLVPRDNSLEAIYSKGFALDEFMPLHGNGIVTKRDELNIHESPAGVMKVYNDFMQLSERELRQKYKIKEDVRDWKYDWAKQDLKDHGPKIPIQGIGYRLFDKRYIFYSGRARGLIGWPVAQVMRHYMQGANVGILTAKAHRDANFAHVFITDKPTEAIHFSATTGSNAMNFPLYLYPEGETDESKRVVNFDRTLFDRFKKLTTDKQHAAPSEMAVFDYIYGVLHCPQYRKSFAEFLKTDFPRIPWPTSPSQFHLIAQKGEKLRKLHLMESNAIARVKATYPYCRDGSDIVGTARHENGRVYINDDQYFDEVPKEVWEFWIGGYQPARKWLKDRKGRVLSFEDIQHYQHILKVLNETRRIMETIML